MAGIRNAVGWKTIIILVLVIGAAAWYYWPPKKVESMQLNDGLHIKFRTHGEQLEMYQNQEWRLLSLKE